MPTLDNFFSRDGLWPVALAGLVGGYFFVTGWMEGRDARLLADEGAPITGEIMSHRHKQDIPRNGKARNHYYLTYRFKPPGAARFQVREEKVDPVDQSTYPVGAEVQVTYAPSDPSVSELRPGALKAAAGDSWLYGFVFTGIGAIVWIWSHFHGASARRD